MNEQEIAQEIVQLINHAENGFSMAFELSQRIKNEVDDEELREGLGIILDETVFNYSLVYVNLKRLLGQEAENGE